jgi:acetyl-CoA C-acetyltransferase
MRAAVIASAVRLPTGKFLGALKDLPATDLGSRVVREAVARAGIEPEAVDECIMGNVVSAGLGQAPARQAALRAGLPDHVGALTINKVCGSGLKAVMLAAQGIATGDIDIAVAGGMESMSGAPYLIPETRWGARMGHARLVDVMLRDGLWDCFVDCHMGNTAETLATRYRVARAEQDRYALQSQQRYQAALQEDRFGREIVAVPVAPRKGPAVEFRCDESPRPDTSLEALAGLRPAFEREGTVTAGNASKLSDGAAAVLVMSEQRAAASGLRPLAWVSGYATAGVDPAIMGIGPAFAIRKLLADTGLSLADIDLLEVNEAFAGQVLAVGRELGWDESRVNVNGGAIALGHPLGASGTRIAVTLLHEMQRRAVRRGIAALCIGGGMGIALLLERD